MKILFLISTLGLGGAEKQLVACADILQREIGARVCVASFDETRTERLPALENLGVPVMIAGRDQDMPRRIQRVVSFARKSRPDVVHAFSFSLSPLALVTAMTVNAAPAASFQGDGVSDLEGRNALLTRGTFAFVNYYTSNSHEAIARVKPRMRPRALVQYVPNLVAPPAQTMEGSRLPRKSGELTVLSVGRMDDNKRLGVFLQALAAARTLEPQLTGVIVGDGPARPGLMEQAASLGLLPQGVRFTGQLLDPSSSYADADMFVHLAISEGTPNVVLEAMAMGLPVVATGAGDLCRIIRPGQNGFLVPFDDVPATAQRLVELARAPELRMRLGGEGRRDVLKSFGSAEVRRSLERFYTAVASRV